jgi:hypothetical protein
MARISIDNVASAMRKVQAMDLSQQLALTDEIYQKQPNMLASCLVQKTLGVGNGGLEHTINILLVCYQSMKESGFNWPIISEEEQDRQMQCMVATVSFSSSFSDRSLSDRATQQYLDTHPEQPLLAYVLNECTSWLKQIGERRSERESDKYALMASVNLVNCIAYAKPITRRA